MKSLIKILVLISFISLSIQAQVDMKTTGQGGVNLKQTGQTTMNFLQIAVSPKAAGIGNSYTALSKGVESVFSNPAGLTEMDSKYQAFVSSTQWFADIKYLAGAVAWNGESYGSVALSFLIVDYGTIRGTALVDAASTSPDNYILTGDIKNVGAYAFGLTYVKQISPKFSIGGTAKYVGQQLGQFVDAAGNVSDNNANKWVFDMGIKYFPGIESLRLGMSMRNFSTFVRYQSFSSPLPITFAVGLGMNIMDLINKNISQDHSILVSTEFLHPNNYTDRVNAGIEYTYMNMISLRAGYESNHDIFSWSGGLGITQSIGGIKFDINYSYSATEYFDGVNRFSLSVAF
ncbi:MAG: PorV/PorQ family protein [Melioribacteraceae bacterium]